MSQLSAGDRICASCGGVNGRHRTTCAGDDPVEVISVYTRKQAIEDGILVDCDQPPMRDLCRQLLKWPLAMTATVFGRYVWPLTREPYLPADRVARGAYCMLSGCSIPRSKERSPVGGSVLRSCSSILRA